MECSLKASFKAFAVIIGAVATFSASPATLFGQTIINVDSEASSIANNTVLPTGATVVVSEGGSIGLGVQLSNGTLQIEGGEVAINSTSFTQGFANFANEIILTGGAVGDFFSLQQSSQLKIAGGSVQSFGVFSGSTAEIFSGAITRFPDILGGGVVNFYGGQVNAVRVFGGGEAHFFGSNFALDGVPIQGLTSNQAFTISERDVTLSGLLSDGTPFETDLDLVFGDFFSSNPDGAASAALVTVTLVSEREPNAQTLAATVDFTSPQQGTIRVLSSLNHSYRLRRTIDLSSLGAIIDAQNGDGSELTFSFDDTLTAASRAFFFLEEVPLN